MENERLAVRNRTQSDSFVNSKLGRLNSRFKIRAGIVTDRWNERGGRRDDSERRKGDPTWRLLIVKRTRVQKCSKIPSHASQEKDQKDSINE